MGRRILFFVVIFIGFIPVKPFNLQHLILVTSNLAATYFEHLDLSNADLSGLNFSQQEFNKCNFYGAILRKTKCFNTRFNKCNLSKVDLGENAELDGASFYSCSLKSSILTSANLAKAVFRFCNLSGAILSESSWCRETFDEKSLQGAILFLAQASSVERWRTNMNG